MNIVKIQPLTGGHLRFYTEDGKPTQPESGKWIEPDAAGVTVELCERATKNSSERATYGNFMQFTRIKFPNGKVHHI